MARAETKENSWSFDQIYDEYKTPIYNYMYHLVGDREQADDLTQDTFLKAFRALPKMDANLKLSAWLYRIATNTAYDALLLYTQEGFSYSEIAQALNIAESGVKMYLSRARQSFREHYKALEQGGVVK